MLLRPQPLTRPHRTSEMVDFIPRPPDGGLLLTGTQAGLLYATLCSNRAAPADAVGKNDFPPVEVSQAIPSSCIAQCRCRFRPSEPTHLSPICRIYLWRDKLVETSLLCPRNHSIPEYRDRAPALNLSWVRRRDLEEVRLTAGGATTENLNRNPPGAFAFTLLFPAP